MSNTYSSNPTQSCNFQSAVVVSVPDPIKSKIQYNPEPSLLLKNDKYFMSYFHYPKELSGIMVPKGTSHTVSSVSSYFIPTSSLWNIPVGDNCQRVQLNYRLQIDIAAVTPFDFLFVSITSNQATEKFRILPCRKLSSSPGLAGESVSS